MYRREALRKLVCLIVVVSTPTVSRGETMAAGLRSAILGRYNKSIPVGYSEEPPEVGFSLSVARILDLNDVTGTLSIEAFIIVSWMDRRLSWRDDPTYENITYFSTYPEDIWKPNINLFNKGHGKNLAIGDLPVEVTQSGKVWWAMDGQLDSVCPPGDFRWFPADSHTCTLVLGSLYPQSFGEVIFGSTDVDEVEDEFDLGYLIDNPHWDVLSGDHRKDYNYFTSDLFYPTFVTTMVIRRCRPLLALSTVCPVICCTLLSWVSFALPPHGDSFLWRVALSTSMLVMDSFFLMNVVTTFPGTGVTTPVIVRMCTAGVIFVFLATLHTILVSKLVGKSSAELGFLQRLPPLLQTFLTFTKKNENLGKEGLVQDEEGASEGPEEFQKEGSSEWMGSSSDSGRLWWHVVQSCDTLHFLLQVFLLLIVFAAASFF